MLDIRRVYREGVSPAFFQRRAQPSRSRQVKTGFENKWIGEVLTIAHAVGSRFSFCMLAGGRSAGTAAI